jgi:ABC-type glutathione transport system ATPase component
MAVVGLLLGTAIYATSPFAKIKYPLLASLFSLANKRRRREKKRRDQEHEEEDKIDSKPLLKWKDIALAVEKKTKKKDAKTTSILSNVSGEAKSGRLLAIVGPSGAGKTSLLNALAKRVPRKGARLTGEREFVCFMLCRERERARVGFDLS